jgi:LytS/YehU family sensor histidine kinase
MNNRMAELEQMALKAQMNPHFIFNSLNSIHKYVMEKDILGANKFITDFARLIRFTLELSSRSKVSIDEEIKYLDTYLKLENARFGNAFSYQLIIDPGIDRQQYHIPPMLLQPYIENSIRHGVRYLQNNTGKITVRFTIKEPYLECAVEDNGIGRKQSQLYKGQTLVEYQSKGMTLTARRLEMMNTNRSIPILLNIEDLETTQATATGTRVVICFPLQDVYNKNVHT